MRQTVRQILSLLLAVVMVIGFFPLSAVASEGWGNSNPDQVTDKLLSLGTASDGTDNDDDGPDDEDNADGIHYFFPKNLQSIIICCIIRAPNHGGTLWKRKARLSR